MDAVNREKLAGNAFRTLGVSASAGQAVIEAAARRMRIWPDASRVPPTPWDLPFLGPVRRSKIDIEQALSLLNQPGSRLEHRLLWFAGDQPPAVDATAGGSPHADAVLGLMTGWTSTDPDSDGTAWLAAVDKVTAACRSDELAAWVQEVEAAGRFDKRSSAEEARAAISAIPAAVGAGLLRLAVAALEEGRVDRMTAIVTAVRRSQLIDSATDPAAGLVDRVEDLFEARCTEVYDFLQERLRVNQESQHRLYQDNFICTVAASEIYDRDVTPALTAAISLLASEPDRLARFRGRCGEILIRLALGWELAGRFVAAEEQLQAALDVSAGTVAELSARRELARIAPLAADERAIAESASSRGATMPADSKLITLADQVLAAPGKRKSAGKAKTSTPVRRTAFLSVSTVLVIAIVNVLRLTLRGSGNDSSGPELTLPRWNPGPFPSPAGRGRGSGSHGPDPFPDPASLPTPLPAVPLKQSTGDDFREP